MKTTYAIFTILVVSLLLVGCSFTIWNKDAKVINPSNRIITEERSVGGFSSIDFRTFGHVILSQGNSESLTIKGSDNVVPVIRTSVNGGKLIIETDENINITGINEKNALTFAVVVKDLTSLTISGAAQVDMDSLSTSKLDLVMSGVGSVKVANLMVDSLNITISGAGGVDVAGEAASTIINISGAGPVEAPDLKIQTATITISGIGSARVWVTDELTGEISGGGSVSYYGTPKTQTKSTGIGHFEALGKK